jgi:hypothetical protein
MYIACNICNIFSVNDEEQTSEKEDERNLNVYRNNT